MEKDTQHKSLYSRNDGNNVSLSVGREKAILQMHPIDSLLSAHPRASPFPFFQEGRGIAWQKMTVLRYEMTDLLGQVPYGEENLPVVCFTIHDPKKRGLRDEFRNGVLVWRHLPGILPPTFPHDEDAVQTVSTSNDKGKKRVCQGYLDIV